MPHTANGVHGHFHETTGHYTVKKKRGRVEKLAQACAVPQQRVPLQHRCTAACCSSKPTYLSVWVAGETQAPFLWWEQLGGSDMPTLAR